MIDSHAHINPYNLSNVDETIKLINDLKHLKYVINVGLDYETSKYVVELSNNNSKFYSVIGIHPLRTGDIADIYNLYKNSNNKRIIGIGETGLDFSKNLGSQKFKFYNSIDLANTLGLPVVIHSNNTSIECLKTLRMIKPQYGFIFHCFQPDLEVLQEIMKMGGYISVGTPITRPNAKKSLEIIKKVDINKLLIELDYPFMSDSVVDDGKKVFNCVREIRNLEFEELENILDENTKTLFKKMKS